MRAAVGPRAGVGGGTRCRVAQGFPTTLVRRNRCHALSRLIERKGENLLHAVVFQDNPVGMHFIQDDAGDNFLADPPGALVALGIGNHGDAAAWPVKAFLSKFRDEFEARVTKNRSFVPKNVVHGVRHRAEKFSVIR